MSEKEICNTKTCAETTDMTITVAMNDDAIIPYKTIVAETQINASIRYHLAEKRSETSI